MIIRRLIVLSLETIKFALNIHQQIVNSETINRPLRCALAATEITGKCQINVPV